jgi:uncharacterized cupredoxin-like copper-binding protein
VGGRRKLVTMVGLVSLVALIGAACGGGGSGSKTGGVDVKLKDFAIDSTPPSVKAGQVTFNIQNLGPSQHEFVVIKTDLAPAQLPMTQEQGVPIVDEEASGLEGVGEKEDINTGTTTSLTLTLAAGKYLFICNIPSHFKLGMVEQFTVSA